ENILILKELANKSGYPYYYLIEGNDPRGIDICLLSKWKVEYISHKDHSTPYKENKNYRFSRDCPEAGFIFNGKKIYLLLNHLKSKMGNQEKSLKKRIAQAKGILDIISLIYKKNESPPYTIIMGDLNSLRYSEPLNILQKSGLKIINYYYKEDKIYTVNYNNNKNDIDYFIVNIPLYKEAKIIKLKNYNYNEFKEISDHFPLCLEIDI
ncbi:MAG: hypothetical protein KAT05_17730, partial [Spirochaetes bacterium]|nr:hypothetical protein [Spirochaetota bacterium]